MHRDGVAAKEDDESNAPRAALEVKVADKTELEITIGPDGEVRIVTHGLKGQACLVETTRTKVRN